MIQNALKLHFDLYLSPSNLIKKERNVRDFSFLVNEKNRKIQEFCNVFINRYEWIYLLDLLNKNSIGFYFILFKWKCHCLFVI